MQTIIRRFFGFDRLIGPVLVRIVYYFGAAVIICVGLFGLFLALMSLLTGNIGGGLMQLIATPAVAAVGLVYWRFLCELFMLAFLAFERLGEVRDLMRIAAGVAPAPSAPDPDHPAF
ncbi:MAG: DUF4282 domain-containing protein [Hyphomonadaceae bacterium]|nr:DUF4282 domain-containing protein [Hyphomonadaceae bacterium]